MKTSLERMQELVNELNYYTKLYDEGHPVISDEEWDNMYFELQRLETLTNTYLVNSPTQKVNYEVVNALQKVEHNHPMLSLDKTKDWDKFLQYFGSKDVVGMLKLDGLTCSLRYVNGKLVSAETRGNGKVGEDILHNAKVISNIPKRIAYKEELVVDGEVICTTKDFEQFSEEYANPRNFAAGSIRLLDARECSKRALRFVAWNEVIGPSATVIDSFTFLQGLGFTITPWTSSFDWDAREFLEDRAKEEGYPIDGLVGRFNDKVYGAQLGSTEHHSRAAYAFKFYDETHKTKLLDIEWSMGRTGVLTPVAIFEPVEIDGTVVSRASLHNYSVMEELLGGFPCRGQKLQIFKANQIIPQVQSAEQNWVYNKKTALLVPEFCPVCGQSLYLEKENDSQVVVCTNPECVGKNINRLDHFCSKKGLDIKGLSKATLEKLMDWGWVETFKDIFELSTHRAEWIQKPGFGVKSVDNILNTINSKRECELAQFLSALGIPLIGVTASKTLAKVFNTWEDFIAAVESDYNFYQLENFGAEMHRAIIHFDYSEAKELVEKYIVFKTINQNAADGYRVLEGLTFVITGKVKRFKNRDELKAKIEAFGGKVTGSVSKNTNYLINNDTQSTSTKNLSAKNLGIPIISEEDFCELIGESN